MYPSSSQEWYDTDSSSPPSDSEIYGSIDEISFFLHAMAAQDPSAEALGEGESSEGDLSVSSSSGDDVLANARASAV